MFFFGEKSKMKLPGVSLFLEHTQKRFRTRTRSKAL